MVKNDQGVGPVLNILRSIMYKDVQFWLIRGVSGYRW